MLRGAIDAALEALARGPAPERAPVRVNAVSPGLVATRLWRGMAEADREAMFADAAGRLPARRTAGGHRAGDFVRRRHPDVTGTAVTVDGGGKVA